MKVWLLLEYDSLRETREWVIDVYGSQDDAMTALQALEARASADYRDITYSLDERDVL